MSKSTKSNKQTYFAISSNDDMFLYLLTESGYDQSSSDKMSEFFNFKHPEKLLNLPKEPDFDLDEWLEIEFPNIFATALVCPWKLGDKATDWEDDSSTESYYMFKIDEETLEVTDYYGA